MISERDVDDVSKLEQAKEAVQAASQSVRETTRSVADAIEATRKPDSPQDRLRRWTRAAPLHALALAFLIGAIIGRRRA